VIECDRLSGDGMGMRGMALLGEMYANRKRAATNKKTGCRSKRPFRATN